MFTADHLLETCRAYCKARGIELTTLSRRMFSRSTRIDEIVDGGDIGVRLLKTKMQWLSDNWPADAAWPKDIERPKSASRAEGAPAGPRKGAGARSGLPASPDKEAAQ